MEFENIVPKIWLVYNSRQMVSQKLKSQLFFAFHPVFFSISLDAFQIAKIEIASPFKPKTYDISGPLNWIHYIRYQWSKCNISLNKKINGLKRNEMEKILYSTSGMKRREFSSSGLYARMCSWFLVCSYLLK